MDSAFGWRYVKTTAETEILCKLLTVIFLNAFNRAWGCLCKMFQKLYKGIGTALLKSSNKVPTEAFVKWQYTEFHDITDKADEGDTFYVDPDVLLQIICLHISEISLMSFKVFYLR